MTKDLRNEHQRHHDHIAFDPEEAKATAKATKELVKRIEEELFNAFSHMPAADPSEAQAPPLTKERVNEIIIKGTFKP